AAAQARDPPDADHHDGCPEPGLPLAEVLLDFLLPAFVLSRGLPTLDRLWQVGGEPVKLTVRLRLPHLVETRLVLVRVEPSLAERVAQVAGDRLAVGIARPLDIATGRLVDHDHTRPSRRAMRPRFSHHPTPNTWGLTIAGSSGAHVRSTTRSMVGGRR